MCGILLICSCLPLERYHRTSEGTKRTCHLTSYYIATLSPGYNEDLTQSNYVTDEDEQDKLLLFPLHNGGTLRYDVHISSPLFTVRAFELNNMHLM